MNGQPFHMIFSPQNSTWDLLDATLTSERRAVANTLIESVKQNYRRKSSHHHLLIGPRGSGKTHLLAFVRQTIERHPDEFPGVIVLALSEEERGLTSLLDFLLACLRAGGVDATELSKEMAGRPRLEVEQAVTRRIEQLANGHLVLVFLENLSSLFAALEKDEPSRLRGFLQTHPHFSLIASSTELFYGSSKADHPFYGFFNITPLRALKCKETADYLASLAESRGDHELATALRRSASRSRLRTIYDLTGGNHRLLAMLGHFLTMDGLADLVGPFVQTVDREMTPYYQQRLDRLSPQQNKILRTIADQHGRALPVKEIAALIFSDSQTVSRQLHDLLNCGLVRRTPRGRESCYELNEPLMRLVLDIKEGRNRPLPLIVSFLTRWHAMDDLKVLAQTAPPEAASYYRKAYDEVGSQLASTMFNKGLQLGTLGQTEDEIATYTEMIKRFGTSDNDVLQEQVAMAMVNKGVAQKMLGRIKEAIATYDEVVGHFGVSGSPELLTQVAMALFNKALALVKLGRIEDAALSLDEVVNRFQASESFEFMEMVAKALFSKSIVAGMLGRHEEMVTICDKVIEQFGESVRPEFQEYVAGAFVNKGDALGSLGREGAAIAIFDEVVHRFGNSNNQKLLDDVAKALFNKGLSLENVGQSKKAIETYNEFIKRFRIDRRLEFQEHIAKALFHKAIALGKIGNIKGEIETYDEIVNSFGESIELELQKQVAKALVNKSAALGILGQAGDEISICDEVVRRYENCNSVDLEEAIAMALVNKGNAFGELGKEEEEAASYDEVITRFGKSEQPELLKRVAAALVNKVLLHVKSGHLNNGFELLESSISRFPDGFWPLPSLVEVVLAVTVDKPLLLCRLGSIFSKRPQPLAEGLIKWIIGHIPLDAAKAQKLEEAETNLKAAWGSIPDCTLPLQLLNAVRRDALGDDKALLDLPLEIRRLVRSDADEKPEATT